METSLRMHNSCMQLLLDADVSVHDDMRDMSKSSCLLPLPLTPLTAKKIPGFAQISWVVLLEAWGSGPLDSPGLASAAPVSGGVS